MKTISLTPFARLHSGFLLPIMTLFLLAQACQREPQTLPQIPTRRTLLPPPPPALHPARKKKIPKKAGADVIHRSQLLPARPPKKPQLGDPAPYQVNPPTTPQRFRGYSFKKARYGLIISLDGVSFQMLQRYRSSLPNISQFIREGFWRPMQVGFPSVTWTSHVSMVTGQYPQRHGIIANRWLEQYQSLIYPYQTDYVESDRKKRTPTLYDLTANKRWATAAINWPATQNANITYNMPEIMYDDSLAYRLLSPALRLLIRGMYFQDYSKLGRWPRKHIKDLVSRLSDSERIETDMFVRDIATHLIHPKHKRFRKAIPRLMLLHFVSSDFWMHKYGPSPWLIRWSLEQMDNFMGKVIRAYKTAGIWDNTASFVVSDHGFMSIQYIMDLRKLLHKKKFSRYRSLSARKRRKERVLSFFNGHTAFLYIKPKYKDQLPTLVKLLKDPKYKQCIRSVFIPSEYRKMGLPSPEEDHTHTPGKHPGAPDLLLLSQPNCMFQRGRFPRVINYVSRYKKSRRQGSHGYLPTDPRMWGIMLARGPGIRQLGQRPLKLAKIVDLAPTMAHLLGLRWPRFWPKRSTKRLKLDGKILTDILKR